jgi:hypothetical protein|tara:strand:- start:318 stop:461 length:144 start_codon:yes stop_codon:yes gene_type:complete
MKDKEKILMWLRKFIDDITDVEVDGEILRLSVHGKTVGIITHQKIWK